MAGKKKTETDVNELVELATPHVEDAIREASESGKLRAINPAAVAGMAGKVVEMLPAILGGLQTLGVPIPANGAAIAAFAVHIFHSFADQFPGVVPAA